MFLLLDESIFKYIKALSEVLDNIYKKYFQKFEKILFMILIELNNTYFYEN